MAPKLAKATSQKRQICDRCERPSSGCTIPLMAATSQQTTILGTRARSAGCISHLDEPPGEMLPERSRRHSVKFRKSIGYLGVCCPVGPGCGRSAGKSLRSFRVPTHVVRTVRSRSVLQGRAAPIDSSNSTVRQPARTRRRFSVISPRSDELESFRCRRTP